MVGGSSWVQRSNTVRLLDEYPIAFLICSVTEDVPQTMRSLPVQNYPSLQEYQKVFLFRIREEPDAVH